MRFKSIIILSFIFLTGQGAFAEEPGIGAFDKFINDDTNGSSFEEAIVLPDICDYSNCKTKDCLVEVFNQTVFSQELKYVVDNFGQREKDWNVAGFDEIDAYVFDDDKYYDDLSVEIVGTKKNKVLHFDVTGPVNSLRQQQFSKRYTP